MSKLSRSLGSARPKCFPTAPEFWVEFYAMNFGIIHHVGTTGLFLDQFLDLLDDWAASRNFGDHVFVEDITSDDDIHYVVWLGS